MVSLCYATLAQIAAELRRRVYGKKARLAGVIPKPTDRAHMLWEAAGILQALADDEDDDEAI